LITNKRIVWGAYCDEWKIYYKLLKLIYHRMNMKYEWVGFENPRPRPYIGPVGDHGFRLLAFDLVCGILFLILDRLILILGCEWWFDCLWAHWLGTNRYIWIRIKLCCLVIRCYISTNSDYILCCSLSILAHFNAGLLDNTIQRYYLWWRILAFAHI